MQTTLLIADDEYFIRQRLKKIIPWTQLDLKLAGEASNGVEVLSILNEQPIDIVLLDIRMPKMLGTEVAAQIHQNHPDTHVIILSGYNEFEYARKALQNGVSDYLLKPVEPASLLASLNKCIEMITQKQKTVAKLDSFERYARSNALANVRDGKLSYAELCIRYPIFSQYRYCAYIGLYTKEDTATGALRLSDLIRSELKLNCEYFQESGHIYVIQLFFDTGADISHLGSLLTDFIATTTDYTFLTANHVFPLSDDWGNYYRQIIASLNQRYFQPTSNLFLELGHKAQKDEKLDLVKLRQTVLEYLNLNDAKNFESFIETSFEAIIQKKNIDFLFSFLGELFITFQIHYKIPANLDTSISQFVTEMIEEEHTCDKLMETLIHYGNQCMSLKQTTPSDVSYCRKITTYIDENYQNPQLSVSSIAEHFQLNASYLGTVFKGVRDQSILQYITKVRIEAAKEMLATGHYLVSEVATAVGYADVFYFSKIFKKNYGYSPKEFIRQHENSKNLD